MRELYNRVRSFLKGRKGDYCETFRGDGAQLRVLQDLAKFCRAKESTYHKDERITKMLDGRREVWLRIEQHLQLSPDDLVRIYHPNLRSIDDE